MTELFEFYDWCDKIKKWIPIESHDNIVEIFTNKKEEPKLELTKKQKKEAIEERRQKLAPFQMQLTKE